MHNAFEWDAAKNVANVTKHGVAFEDAVRVFDGSHLTFRSDRGGEARLLVLGEVEGIVLALAITERPKATRVISARRASRDERKAYHEAFPDRA